MNCSQFMAAFSDYVDGTGSTELLEAARGHRDACERCRRYEAVYRRGREVLQGSSESVDVDVHFHDRLQHRLFHVDDERALARTASPGSSAVVLGAAALMAAIVGVPALFEPDPEVELSPIVVSSPAARPLGLRILLPSLMPPSVSPAALELEGDDLWQQPSDLFYDYAPIRARYRDASGSRLGLQ